MDTQAKAYKPQATFIIARWCNGNTTDFDSVTPGSIPGWASNKGITMDKDKCAVEGCRNMKWQGKFHGTLCIPCFNYLTKSVENGAPTSPAAAKEDYNRHIEYLKQAELQIVCDKYATIG